MPEYFQQFWTTAWDLRVIAQLLTNTQKQIDQLHSHKSHSSPRRKSQPHPNTQKQITVFFMWPCQTRKTTYYESGNKIAITQSILHGLTWGILCAGLNILARCWQPHKGLIYCVLKWHLRSIWGILNERIIAQGQTIIFSLRDNLNMENTFVDMTEQLSQSNSDNSYLPQTDMLSGFRLYPPERIWMWFILLSVSNK